MTSKAGRNNQKLRGLFFAGEILAVITGLGLTPSLAAEPVLLKLKAQPGDNYERTYQLKMSHATHDEEGPLSEMTQEASLQ